MVMKPLKENGLLMYNVKQYMAMKPWNGNDLFYV